LPPKRLNGFEPNDGFFPKADFDPNDFFGPCEPVEPLPVLGAPEAEPNLRGPREGAARNEPEKVRFGAPLRGAPECCVGIANYVVMVKTR
jgi:hypothetical protein